MKKTLTLLVALILILTLTGCGCKKETTTGKTSKTKSELTKKYKNYVPLKDLPVYPGAKRFGDVEADTYLDDIYLKWTYKTDASANEIYEYFKTTFESMGYNTSSWGTYIIEDKFGVVAINEKTDKYLFQVSYSVTEELSEEITPDTPNRHYLIAVNIEQCENK